MLRGNECAHSSSSSQCMACGARRSIQVRCSEGTPYLPRAKAQNRTCHTLRTYLTVITAHIIEYLATGV